MVDAFGRCCTAEKGEGAEMETDLERRFPEEWISGYDQVVEDSERNFGLG